MKEPKIYRRTRDGVFEFCWYVDGKRKRTSLRTSDEMKARAMFTKITGLPSPVKKNNGIPVINQPTAENNAQGALFVKAYDVFFRSKYGMKDAWKATPRRQCTKKSTVMRGTLKGFKAHSGVFYLSEIKFSHIQSFADMKAQTCKNAGVNNHIQRLRRFLKFCVNHDWLAKNEADKWEPLKQTTPIRYSFTDKELNLVWENMDSRFLSYYQLMNETGLRACDMWKITKDDFRDGDDGMELHLQQDKTDKWLRVPISKKAEDIVNSLDHRLFPWADKTWWLERELHDQRTQCINSLWMCFGAKHAGPGPDDWGQLERGRIYCKPDNIRQHTFRHTFAMRHLNNGTPLEALKDLLGHRDVRMTQIYASQMTPKTLSQFVRKP